MIYFFRFSISRVHLVTYKRILSVRPQKAAVYVFVIFGFSFGRDGRNANREKDGEDESDERSDGSCEDHEETRVLRRHDSYER